MTSSVYYARALQYRDSNAELNPCYPLSVRTTSDDYKIKHYPTLTQKLCTPTFNSYYLSMAKNTPRCRAGSVCCAMVSAKEQLSSESLTKMLSQIACINNHLFLSGLQALTPERLRQHGITQIVTAMVDPPPSKLLSAVSSHVQITVEDSADANIRIYFDCVGDRIAKEARCGGKTLVHCMAGISRSSTLILAYLIKHQRMRLADAYKHVKAIRPCIQPNVGFWQQLIAYEELHRKTCSMRITSDSKSDFIGASDECTLTSTRRGWLENRNTRHQYPVSNSKYYTSQSISELDTRRNYSTSKRILFGHY